MKNVALATTEEADKEIRFWNLPGHGPARLVIAKTFSIEQETAMLDLSQTTFVVPMSTSMRDQQINHCACSKRMLDAST